MPTAVTINNTQYSLPNSWQECTSAQFVSLCLLVQQRWQLNSIKPSKKTEELLNTDKRANELAMLYILLGAPMGTFKHLTAEQQLDLLEPIKWVATVSYPKSAVITQFRHRNTLYKLKKFNFNDYTLADYVLVEGILRLYTKNPTAELLNEFLLNTTVKPKSHARRSDAFISIDPALAGAILFQFIGALKVLQQRYPHVFPNQESQTSDSKEQKSGLTGWGEIIDTMIAPSFGSDISKAKTQPLHDALGVLNRRSKENKQKRKQLQKHKV